MKEELLVFFKKKIGGHKSFLWGHPFWTSSDVSLFTLGRGVRVRRSLRFTSGVTPADLLVASMATELISSTYLQPDIGGARTGDL